jgi:hypothetical protein
MRKRIVTVSDRRRKRYRYAPALLRWAYDSRKI